MAQTMIRPYLEQAIGPHGSTDRHETRPKCPIYHRTCSRPTGSDVLFRVYRQKATIEGLVEAAHIRGAGQPECGIPASLVVTKPE